jgi:formylglycine-generating enzyme required for sulfatase activity
VPWRNLPRSAALVAALWQMAATTWAQAVTCTSKDAPASLVRIENDGRPGGTGVVIVKRDTYAIVLTAKHVITPRDFAVYFNVAPSQRVPVRFTDETILIFPPDGDVDLAMFRVDARIPAAVLPEDPYTGEMTVGAPVVSWGFPNSRGGTLCAHDGKLLRTAAGQLVVDGQVEEGVSGGPAFFVDPTTRVPRLAGIVVQGDKGTTSALDIRQVVPMVGNTPDPRNAGKPYGWPNIVLSSVIDVDARLRQFVKIGRGDFLMGGDRGDEQFPADTGKRAGPRRVMLPTFFMSKYEVTVAQYRECVTAKRCRDPGGNLGADEQDHPVSGVSWYDASGYAEWLQSRLVGAPETPRELRRLLDAGWTVDLPSEEEWEKGARLEGTAAFPWGKDPNPRCANYNSDQLRRVGSSRCRDYAYGLADMAGNVREWTRSLKLAYPYDATKAEVPAATGPRAVRGGSAKRIVVGAERVRAANREEMDPNELDTYTGFRVALSCRRERGCGWQEPE